MPLSAQAIETFAIGQPSLTAARKIKANAWETARLVVGKQIDETTLAVAPSGSTETSVVYSTIFAARAGALKKNYIHAWAAEQDINPVRASA